MNWAVKGFQYIRDIWSKEDNDWRPALDLLRTTRSRKTNELRTEIINNIPRAPTQGATLGDG